jgi:predicted aspartyl protease/Flp pilus assembly protein TadD
MMFASVKSVAKDGAGGLPGVRLVLLATVLLFLGSTVSAVRIDDDSAKKATERVLRDARKSVRGGEYKKAVRLYQQLLDTDPQNISARLGMALAYIKDFDYQSSFEHGAEALKIDSNNARAHAIVGLALLRSGFVANALAELIQSVKLNPREALAFGAAAEIDFYEGRPRDARLKAQQAYVLDPDEPDYLITLARACSRIELFGEAADAYEQFLLVSPKNDKERRDRIQGLISFYRQIAGIQVHQLSGTPVALLPFHLGTDRRPYVQVRVNGRPGIFVIDTGSGFTVISKEAASRFGVGEMAHGGTSQGVGGTGKFDVIYGLVRNFQLGDIKMKSVPCFIRPFHGMKDRPPEERPDGFIGLSVLSHFLTELDYKESTIRLDRNTEGPTTLTSTTATRVPFRTTQNGLISIETELDGNHRINAILDSGASSTVISMKAVDRLNMRDKIIKGQTVRVIGAAGVSENVELLFLRNCRVADLEQSNLRALVLDFGAINETSGFEQGGILGGDFLRHFRIAIDFNKGMLAMEPHSPVKD